MMKSLLTSCLLAICASMPMMAQSEVRYDIIDVETLQKEASIVAASCLEAAPVFYGYTAVLHTDEQGVLTTNTYPLDATFRYALPEGIAVNGSGITVNLDAMLRPEVYLGQFTAGKLPIVGEYMPLAEAVTLFMASYPNFSNLTPVVFFHNEDMPEPIYLFIVEAGQFMIGAISGASGIVGQ